MAVAVAVAVAVAAAVAVAVAAAVAVAVALAVAVAVAVSWLWLLPRKVASRLRKTSIWIRNSFLVYTKHPLATIVLKLPTRPLVKYPLIFVRRRG